MKPRLIGMVEQSEGQPPSGGCELKLFLPYPTDAHIFQPPSGGCELKLFLPYPTDAHIFQPPSGGCELKQQKAKRIESVKKPAAFGRL